MNECLKTFCRALRPRLAGVFVPPSPLCARSCPVLNNGLGDHLIPSPSESTAARQSGQTETLCWPNVV